MESKKIGCRSDFGGSVTLKSHARVGVAHAATIVDDLYQRPSGITQYDVDRGRSRIHCVFNELLDHRRRTLDHLAGGYLIGYRIGQQAYYIFCHISCKFTLIPLPRQTMLSTAGFNIVDILLIKLLITFYLILLAY